jgi:hypothetical protein
MYFVQRLFHFSQDSTIELFVPHVARTSTETEPFVWAVDELHAPSYWFHLWPLIDAVVASGLEFSVIWKANAQPRPL